MTEKENNLPSTPSVPEPDGSDIAYGIGRAILSLIPLPVAPIAEMMIRSPMDKRVDNWRIELTKVVEHLNERLDKVEFESLKQSEEFATTFLHVSRVAVSTHRKEKHVMLRNSLLNTALPNGPEDDERTVFLNLVEEFSVAHIRTLNSFRLFVDNETSMSISLASDSWRQNVAVSHLYNFVRKANPDMSLDFHLFLSVLPELNNRGLIANEHPEPNLPSTLTQLPTLTVFGRRFLDFIESPLDDD